MSEMYKDFQGFVSLCYMTVILLIDLVERSEEGSTASRINIKTFEFLADRAM